MSSNNTSKMLTIGMPVYNDVLFLEEALRSILNQSHTDFALVISDDCSSDGSEEICKKLALEDDRVHYIRQDTNIGISKNMEFLLEQSQSKYFMWAADDDLWAPDFVKNLIEQLEDNPDAIVAFCKYQDIDDQGNYSNETRSYNYTNANKKTRVKNFIQNSDDQFGYGIFVRSRIEGVKFPIWWWPNRNSSYNNIFPTLCYYLSRGNYVHYEKNPLFFKRVKKLENMNHLLPGRGHAIKETFAYIIRRFNLVIYSSNQIFRADGIKLMLQTFPILFHYWFIKSSWVQITLAVRSFWKHRVARQK